MAVVKCANSHYYDNEKYKECPHCASAGLFQVSGNPVDSTAFPGFIQGAGQLDAAREAELVEACAAEYIRRNSRTQSRSGDVQTAGLHVRSGDEQSAGWNIRNGQSAGLHIRSEDAQPAGLDAYKNGTARYAAGWLVCTRGADYGRNFPLYAGFNRIGRGADNDIVLQDARIAEKDHCSVVYEERKNSFYLFSRAGSLVYLDGETVEGAMEIADRQTAVLGDTGLVLVVFCTGEIRWVRS